MTELALITAGNPNLKTLANVLVTSQRHFLARIDSVFLIDTDGSTTGKDGESLEGERNALVRRYTHPHVRIAQRSFPGDSLARAVPMVVSEELSLVSRDRVVVDLTNGTKTLTSLLYASASLLQLERLFFLTLLPSGYSKEPEELDASDYRIDVLRPLEDVNALKPFALFELVYYRQDMAELMTLLLGRFPRKQDLVAGIGERIDEAVVKYFAGDAAGAAGAAGKAGESLARLVIGVGEEVSDGMLFRGAAKRSHVDRINAIRTRLCEPLRSGLTDEEALPAHLRALIGLRYADGYLDVLRCVRNDASHERLLSVGREEARLTLDLVRLLVRGLGTVA